MGGKGVSLKYQSSLVLESLLRAGPFPQKTAFSHEQPCFGGPLLSHGLETKLKKLKDLREVSFSV